MGFMHRIHWKSASTWFDAIQEFLKMESSWTDPYARMDRIIFPNIGIARQFLSTLPNTSWRLENTQKPSDCKNKCQDPSDANKTPLEATMSPLENSPAFICSINTAYQLAGLLNILGSAKKTAKLEVLCQNVEQELLETQYFLQDKSEELGLTESPRFSLIEPEFEISMSANDHKKKRNRKPSPEFQHLLKKYKPNWYPNLIGNEYYGQKVFLSFLNLHKSQTTNQLKTLYPPSPMKYYDLQPEGMLEIRFSDLIPLSLFKEWIVHLYRITTQWETQIIMLRASFFLNAWELENYHMKASRDRFYFSWNDSEMAFTQQDFDFMHPSLSLENNTIGTSIYFELTSTIEDNDPRIQKLSQIVSSKIDLK